MMPGPSDAEDNTNAMDEIRSKQGQQPARKPRQHEAKGQFPERNQRPQVMKAQPPKPVQQPKAKKPRHRLPYILQTDPTEFELRFYERYDESYLFNKAVTLMYAVEHGDAFKQLVQTYIEEWQGGELTDKYFESLRAEMFFMTLHQFEALFALLIAPFQPIPTWIYLTTYGTEDMKSAIDRFLLGDLDSLSGGYFKQGEERAFLAETLYQGSKRIDPEFQARWDENLDNVAWLIRRLADLYLTHLKAYNSYKHGLRTMTGANATFALRLNDASGNPTGPGFTRSSEDSLSFLELDQHDNSTTVHEKTIFFDPTMGFFYIVKMHQMLETIKATRLAALRSDDEGPKLNMFLNINKDGIVQQEAQSRFEFTWQA